MATITTKQYQIMQKTAAEEFLKIHPETDAEIVLLASEKLTSTNVKDAVEELYSLISDITGGGVVTGVKGSAETEYRTGDVEITKENIGLGNVDNTSDADKPVSTAQQTAIDDAVSTAKEEILASEVPASQVILSSDIPLAGNYTSVGNIDKGSTTASSTYAAAGMTVEEFLTAIFSKELQPEITTAVSASVTLTSSGAKEVGTSFTPKYSVSFNSGAYTYDDSTGVSVISYAVSDSNGNTATTSSGSFDAFTVGDSTSYKITAVVTYSDGNVAKTNLGNDSDPAVQITSGSKTVTSGTVSGYRSMFVYVGTDTSEITGTWIRSNATNKGNSTAPGSLTIADGTKRVMIAIPASKNKTLKSVIDVDGMGLDVAANFTQTTVAVEGLNGYAEADYDVWYYENANGLSATTYTVTMA